MAAGLRGVRRGGGTVAVRLVALDLDGTVLGPGTEIAAELPGVLRRAADAGVWITLATGRMLLSAAGVQRRLGIEGPLLAYNGGAVRLTDGAGWSEGIPLAAAHAIGRLCRERGYFLQCYLGDEVFVSAADPRADAYSALAGVGYRVDPETAFFPASEPAKLLVIEPVERQPQVRAAVAEAAAGAVSLFHSYPHYLEIVRAGVDKGTALARLTARLGLEPAEVMAVGDAENDLPMVTYAGIGVAVANAGAVLRSAADYVCEAPCGAGVAEAIRRFAL